MMGTEYTATYKQSDILSRRRRGIETASSDFLKSFIENNSDSNLRLLAELAFSFLVAADRSGKTSAALKYEDVFITTYSNMPSVLLLKPDSSWQLSISDISNRNQLDSLTKNPEMFGVEFNSNGVTTFYMFTPHTLESDLVEIFDPSAELIELFEVALRNAHASMHLE